jgi:plasmid stabilization system protein ParE
MAKARKTKVILSERAIDDLLSIEVYSTEKWGKATADRYLDAFDNFFALVETQPGILLPIPIIDGLLTHCVEKHVVVCTKWNDDILVLTIVHSSRELIAHLDRLLPTLKSEVELLKKRIEK